MLRFMTAGESHGPCLTAIIEGIPAGLKLDISKINAQLARRQLGFGRGGRMKIETDKAEILSGVRFGETLGGPITLRITNRDWANWTERMAVEGEPHGAKVTAARPGHADFVGINKYNRQDIRDILERSSARETTARVALGGIARQFLEQLGIDIVSQVVTIGGISIDKTNINYQELAPTDNDLNCRDLVAYDKMCERIREAMRTGDTLGGIFEVVIRNMPMGIGSYIQWDQRLEAQLTMAMMSIQAIKAVEIGEGFQYGMQPGSALHDEMYYNDHKQVYRKTNHAGGIEGGMSNGEPIIVRACMKPIPTLMRPLHSIDIATQEEVLANTERSDVCAVGAASVVGEAMMSLAISKAILDTFGSGAMVDIVDRIHNYRIRTNR